MYRSNNLEKLFLSEPCRYEFLQALYLLSLLVDEEDFSLERGQRVLLKSNIFLSAPASDISKIKPFDRSSAFGLKGKKRSHYMALVNFIGIAGAQGPLPTVYTEMILRRQKLDDRVLEDFLDIFNHRLLSLFFKIYQKALPTLSPQRAESTFLGKTLLSLSGVSAIKSFPEEKQHFFSLTQIFWKRPRTPHGLSQMIKLYFGLDNVVRSFVGRFYEVPLSKQTCLKRNANTCLGHTFVLGKRAFCAADGFLLNLIFQDKESFLSFLPGRQKHLGLVRVVRLYLGQGLSFFLSLKLKGNKVFRLNYKKAPLLLGWTTWLLGKDSKATKSAIMIQAPLL